MAVQQAIDNNIDLSDADFQGQTLDSLLAAGAQLNRRALRKVRLSELILGEPS
jgi:uncharacterized protein YjbI with pentapeptide repeats